MPVQVGKTTKQKEKQAIMGLKLSIIVPIYRVEQYLSKCIDSLLNQDLSPEDYEIILVDDGSPDRCGEICEEYAARFSNIMVVHRENGGLSAARNSGIEVAQGKYVQFVDSDDFIEPDVLRTLVDKMEFDKLDILRFNYQNVNEQYEVFEPNKVSKPFVDYCDEVCNGLTFLTERLGFGCYAWQFMIRRELLEGCRFKEGIYFEDTEWAPRLLMKAQRVTSTDLLVYNYLMRQGSITQSVDEERKRKVLDDKLLLMDSMKEQMRDVADKRWFEGMIAQTVLSILGYASVNYKAEIDAVCNALKLKNVFPLSTYHATKLARHKIRIANVSPRLLCWLMNRK
jgi:glycosyltransferase involved in cell wall biosynthesis